MPKNCRSFVLEVIVVDLLLTFVFPEASFSCIFSYLCRFLEEDTKIISGSSVICCLLD